MKQVKVGVIGLGRMGERHTRIFSGLRKAQLVGVCDVNPDVGQRVARQFEVPFFDQMDELLKRVDAVSIAASTPSHFQLAMHCIDRGVHVMVEKPITETLEDAEILARAADASHSLVMVGHIERFNPAYIELKNVLDEIPPLVINIQRLSPFQGSNKDVDVVLDLMIHDLNLIHDLMGREPDQFNANGLKVLSDRIDHAIAQLCFENGPIATLTASRITEEKIRKIDVTCRDAYLECDLLNKNIYIHRCTIGEYLTANKRGVKYRQESVIERINIPSFEPLLLELQSFVDCILENKPATISARDGFLAMKMALRIRDTIIEHQLHMNGRNGTGHMASQPDRELTPTTIA
jgi:predicted dehydrogenase